MIKQEHVQSLLADYVLELLTPAERLRVEEHTAACDSCRLTLQREKHLALMIGSTLHLAAQPGNNGLHAFMPQPPRPVRPVTRRQRVLIPRIRFNAVLWATQLAPMTLALLLVVSSLWLYLASPADPWRNGAPGSFMATETAATATATATATSLATSSPTSSPIATLADGRGLAEGSGGQTAVPVNPAYDPGQPAATPIAQVMPEMVQTN
jgi:anti-sigma factor RsiW